MSDLTITDLLDVLIRRLRESHIGMDEAVREFRKRFIVAALEANRGNQSKTARDLGVHRNTLMRTMGELEIPARGVGWRTNNRRVA